MALIDKTGISNGNTIQSAHITNLYDALSGVGGYHINTSGSFTGSLNGSSSFATSASRATSASFATSAITATTSTSASFASTASLYAGYYGVTYSPTITTVGSKQYYPVEFSLPSVGDLISGGTNTRSSVSFKVTVSATHVLSNSPTAGGSFKRQQISYDAIAYNDNDDTLVITYASSSIGDSIAACGLEEGSNNNSVKFWVNGTLTATQNNAHVSIQYNTPVSATATIVGVG